MIVALPGEIYMTVADIITATLAALALGAGIYAYRLHSQLQTILRDYRSIRDALAASGVTWAITPGDANSVQIMVRIDPKLRQYIIDDFVTSPAFYALIERVFESERHKPHADPADEI